MSQTIITNSSEETKNLGAALVHKIKNNILALYGDLGSGKTTFVQGLAKTLGIHKKIISPTFIIMRVYNILTPTHNSSFTNLYHVDLYRIKQPAELQDLGILELIKDHNNLFVIEWPEKIENLLPKKRINLRFQYIDQNKREIIID